MAVIRSRVVDTRNVITSRTGRERAVKARQTLATAQSICRASGDELTANALAGHIDQLGYQINDYNRRHSQDWA